MRTDLFFVIYLIVGAAIFAAAFALGNDWYFFAGYVVLQYIQCWRPPGTSWRYCSYVIPARPPSLRSAPIRRSPCSSITTIPVLIVIGGIVAGIIGFGMGYLTLRLRGAFFAIATLALAHHLAGHRQLGFVGGSRRLYHPHPGLIWPLEAASRPIFVPGDDAAGGGRDHGGAADRALAARLRLCHHSRRRWPPRLPACRPLQLKLIATTISAACSWAWPAHRFPTTSAFCSRPRPSGSFM